MSMLFAFIYQEILTISVYLYFPQYVSEVVIGAPYAVTDSLMSHFNVSTLQSLYYATYYNAVLLITI